MNGERPCSKCGIRKPPEGFHQRRPGGRRDGRRSECIDCHNQARLRAKRSKADRLEALDWRTTAPVIPCPKNRVPGSEGRFWSPEERFWQMTEPGDNGCILWTGSRHPRPQSPGKFYGRFSAGRGSRYAHRYAYGLAHGKIPDQFHVHHTCRNSLCVNPEHLQALSETAHHQVSVAALKTHCPHGHLYDEQNTIRRRGSRFCRTCKAISSAAGNAKRAEKRRAKRLKAAQEVKCGHRDE